ncbi:SDR family oxidoreductase [bacterium]|nr:SDR family oxidoreductase [bacterium]
MKKVLVTGYQGFLGKNLCTALSLRENVQVLQIGSSHTVDQLHEALAQADLIYHLAGVNRPESPEEFVRGNVDLTASMTSFLERTNQPTPIIFSSSIQADLDNPYGRSKRMAESVLLDHSKATQAKICIYRFPNIFGKWSRPDYNTVVATFCYNIARDLEITIGDPDKVLELVYIDDVVVELLRHLEGHAHQADGYGSIQRTFRVTLGELASKIRSFREIRDSLLIPDLSEVFTRFLHATYLSFLPSDGFGSHVKLFKDDRGWLFELIKSDQFGQIFVSKTHPGITRGNHFHNSKIEKFCVIQGRGTIRFRLMGEKDVISYHVNDGSISIVDIPPGYTHSIENSGSEEMICLFWANTIFDPKNPDTFYREVQA